MHTSSRLFRQIMGIMLAFVLLCQMGYPEIAHAGESFPSDVSVVDVTKPAVVEVQAGATATFRFSDRAWPVAVGGVASGLVVNPDGVIITSSRIVDLLKKDQTSIRQALADRFFDEVQKQVGRRLSESERLGIAQNTTLMEEVKTYQQVLLSDGQKYDFQLLWAGSPPQEVVLNNAPVVSYRPKASTAKTVKEEGVEPRQDEGVSPVPTPAEEPTEVEQPVPVTSYPSNREFDALQEVAVVKIQAEKMPSMLLSPAGESDSSKAATVIGFPGNADPTALLTPGTVTEVAENPGTIVSSKTGKGKEAYGSLLDIEATLAPAAASGPVVTGDGRIVGLAGKTAKGTGLYPMVNSQAVLEALQKAGQSNKASDTTSVYAKALSMYNQGYTSKAISILDDVLDMFPHHGPAKALLADAKARLENGEDRIYWPDFILHSVITLLIVAAGGAYLWIRYKKGRRKQSSTKGTVPSNSEDITSSTSEKKASSSPISFLISKEEKNSPTNESPIDNNMVDSASELPSIGMDRSVSGSILDASVDRSDSRAFTDSAATDDSNGKGPEKIPSPAASIKQQNAVIPVIEFFSGMLTGRKYVIPKKGLLIGRDPSACQIALKDPVISKQHLFIGPDPFDHNSIIVTDKMSTNGTFINSPDGEKLVGSLPLKDGDKVFLGKQNGFVLRLTDEE
ncbi:FHA domain-containing protein [Heliobacterium chlorum]|uniref:FHA domain-containing protein n=1 Tax=Heliobacterium chlorum TaxID=2698 RepID=A0ABR7T290_HELCL|nr:FHA domain-containing protein [Heliobacterium chlorum]MBC9784892.1 FHA domain-containing protein [Heliobacterium chlorum]